MSIDRCGYAVVYADGEEGPCDRIATGWRWYQDVSTHEDALDVACDFHRNEGGRRIHAVEALCAKVIDVHAQVQMDTPEDKALHALAVETFRAALAAITEGDA